MRHCREIYEHNERYKKGLETFEMGINQFADTTAVVESQYVLQTRNKLTVLSEQGLLDCETSSEGCSGGSTFNAVEFVMKHGIAREEDYPYTHVQGVCQCKEKGCSDHPKILKILQLRSKSEEELKMVVAFLGPVAFNFDGGMNTFLYYNGGVYSKSNCRAHYQFHSMVIVGYGTENGQDYWLAKNSWGHNWGEKGYIRIARNKNNYCGIANNVFLPMYKTRRPW
ncbi:cathepsin L-like proteinase [Cloeon dipterum]|uniref:cathepsin L-like proteinase n=1 Tax=Cloeon dipterum TaxID=197152 RepID=UPI00322007E1